MKYLSQIPIYPSDEPLRGPGTLGNPGSEAGAVGLFIAFISGLIGLMTIIAGLWFLFNIFFGAIGIIGAGGDAKKMEGAQAKLTTGIIGIVVVISAIFIVDFIGSFLGLELLNPIRYLETIVPGR
ncbi:MAG: hypothetical protein UV74_C0001G0095 [Candidatus Woesebacteria bacterium GW2011_GWB1_43_14]|uniref:Uncharacterized protein n=1 Tax=Candidatus Woesebacteria bacterium GW2011_GWB1_43_14 TaxID=1618578 RepID=A0A0G1DM71_9BACT|nr:MAG: hypothetical protein UV51_C0002G0084 [Candidatus Woesebacteria bacterium GW2011_GWC1_42_9]KKS98985.1 MAG: hypothetical protein UV74_C0001G0095 [Candidatus Woesebacteria bacterium GW2011_GWB1_43_14]